MKKFFFYVLIFVSFGISSVADAGSPNNIKVLSASISTTFFVISSYAPVYILVGVFDENNKPMEGFFVQTSSFNDEQINIVQFRSSEIETNQMGEALFCLKTPPVVKGKGWIKFRVAGYSENIEITIPVYWNYQFPSTESRIGLSDDSFYQENGFLVVDVLEDSSKTITACILQGFGKNDFLFSDLWEGGIEPPFNNQITIKIVPGPYEYTEHFLQVEEDLLIFFVKKIQNYGTIPLYHKRR